KRGIVRWTKVPFNSRTGRKAASNRRTTWSSFGDATEALKKGYKGLGFSGGFIEPWAEEILCEVDSYSELSPSRTGVHAIAKGELPDGPRQKDFKDREHHGVGL